MAKFDTSVLAPLDAPAFTGNISAKNAATFTTAGANATDREVLTLNNPFVGGSFTGVRIKFQAVGVDAATVYGTIDGSGPGGKLFLRTAPAAGGATVDGLTIDSAQTVLIPKQLDMQEIAAPASPIADTLRMYVKDVAGVSHLFTKNSAGLETDLNAGGGGGVSVTVSATPPPAPTNGSLWYDLSTGVMSAYINDGNSSQWVQVSPGSVGNTTAIPIFVTNSGRLQYVSPTALSFVPFNGDQIKISGSLWTIPAAGITCANTGVNVNGTPGNNLAANTTYLVVLQIGAPLTPIFYSGQTHGIDTTAGNVGTEIVIGSPGAALIGMCRTNASGQFADSVTQRFVISWFNRRNKPLQGASTSSATVTGGTFLEFNSASRVEFISWGEEAFAASMTGHANNTVTNYARLSIGLDGPSSVLINEFLFKPAVASDYGGVSGTANFTVTEGYHFITPIGRTDSGTATGQLGVYGMIRG